MKTNKEGFIKDDITKVIINNNEHELALYKSQKAAILQRKTLERRITELEQRVALLENRNNK